MRRGFGRRRLGGRGIGLIGVGYRPSNYLGRLRCGAHEVLDWGAALGFGTEAQDDPVAVQRVDVKWIATREQPVDASQSSRAVACP